MSGTSLASPSVKQISNQVLGVQGVGHDVIMCMTLHNLIEFQ